MNRLQNTVAQVIKFHPYRQANCAPFAIYKSEHWNDIPGPNTEYDNSQNWLVEKANRDGVKAHPDNHCVYECKSLNGIRFFIGFSDCTIYISPKCEFTPT